MGMIYDEPNHSFINKWLLLSDPEQMSDGHKGYLKISVALLGPGDDPPVSWEGVGGCLRGSESVNECLKVSNNVSNWLGCF